MKIYIENFFPKNIEKLDSLYKKFTTYKDIYSPEGIFRIQNDNLFKLIPKDINIIHEEHEDNKKEKIRLLIDQSYYEFKKDINCIPYNHIIYNIEKIEYKFDNKSKISLVVEKYNNVIKDIYFITKEEKLHIYLKNNILEFVSLLNNIKQY